MTETRSSYRVYALLVATAGLTLLAMLSLSGESLAVLAVSQPTLILWMAMVCIAAMAPIPIPRGGRAVGMVSALDVAGILVFGPMMAAWFAVLSRFVASIPDRRSQMPRGLYALGEAVLATGGAGVVYTALGGNVGIGVLAGFDQFLPVVAAAAAYLGIQAILSMVGLAILSGNTLATAVATVVRSGFAYDAAMLPFGFLLALIQDRTGPVGVALGLFPMLLLRHVFKFWIDSKAAHLYTVRTMMAAVDGADPLTRGHAVRIAGMSKRVGREIGLNPHELDTLEYAALLHDLGRTAIQRDVLDKSGRLNAKEHAQVREHPRLAYEMIQQFKFFPAAAEAVHAHHEQPDGKGYPRGLAAEQIPMSARIIMTVAAFDAMTSDRPYRRGLSPDAAFEELLAHSGTQFFPEIVETLIHLYAEGTLFEDIPQHELQEYIDGRCNSRAIAAHLASRGLLVDVPEKVGRDARSLLDDGVPEIGLEQETESGSKVLRIAADLIPGTLRLEGAGLTDTGCVRTNNEDAFGMFPVNPERGFLMVLADGMGGAAAGEVASEMAVSTVQKRYSEPSTEAPAQALEEAIQDANHMIHFTAQGDERLGGMGTTCTAVAVIGDRLELAHVGDSRAYLWRQGTLRQLTQDHTLAAELQQLVGPRGPRPDGSENVLTRALGNQPRVEIARLEETAYVQPGDVIVLCSDGLSNQVSDEELAQVLAEHAPADACRELVDRARAAGGPDNITVQVARLAA